MNNKVVGVLSVEEACYGHLSNVKCVGHVFTAKVIADFGGRFPQDACIDTSTITEIDLDFSDKFIAIKTRNSIYFVVKELDKAAITEAFKRMVEMNYE